MAILERWRIETKSRLSELLVRNNISDEFEQEAKHKPISQNIIKTKEVTLQKIDFGSCIFLCIGIY